MHSQLCGCPRLLQCYLRLLDTKALLLSWPQGAVAGHTGCVRAPSHHEVGRSP